MPPREPDAGVSFSQQAVSLRTQVLVAHTQPGAPPVARAAAVRTLARAARADDPSVGAALLRAARSDPDAALRLEALEAPPPPPRSSEFRPCEQSEGAAPPGQLRAARRRRAAADTPCGVVRGQAATALAFPNAALEPLAGGPAPTRLARVDEGAEGGAREGAGGGGGGGGPPQDDDDAFSMAWRESGGGPLLRHFDATQGLRPAPARRGELLYESRPPPPPRPPPPLVLIGHAASLTPY